MFMQFYVYCDVLCMFGVELIELLLLEVFFDLYFVEDVVVVMLEFVVIMCFGVFVWCGEMVYIEVVFVVYCELLLMQFGCFDGGDVMQVGKCFFIGLMSCIDVEGIVVFDVLVLCYGYLVVVVLVGVGLYLKLVVNVFGDDMLFVIDVLVVYLVFVDYCWIVILVVDEYVGNMLCVNGMLIMLVGYLCVYDVIVLFGMLLYVIDMSEFCKMDGGLICLLLWFQLIGVWLFWLDNVVFVWNGICFVYQL